MYSVWLTDDQQRIWRDHLTMVARLEAATQRRLQREHGLSLADYGVLVALSDRRACRVNELGTRLAWEQSRLSHQLRRMRERGLLLRRDARDDRRGATVELTAAGRRALGEAAPEHAELVRRLVFADVDRAELAAAHRWMTTVLERLAALDGAPTDDEAPNDDEAPTDDEA